MLHTCLDRPHRRADLTRLILLVLLLLLVATGCGDDASSTPEDTSGDAVTTDVSADTTSDGTGTEDTPGGDSSDAGQMEDADQVGDTGQGSAVALGGFIAAASAGLCTQLFQCGQQGETALIRALLVDPPTCEGLLPKLLGVDIPVGDIQAAVSDGRIVYDAEAAAECISFFETRCLWPEDNVMDSICGDVFTGQVAVGGDCTLVEECVPGAYCTFANAQSCPGICAAQVAVGEACEASEQCLFGGTYGVAVCYDPGTGGTCVDLELAEPAQAGAPCGFVDNGGPTLVACDVGLWCDADAGSSGACLLPIAAGESCTPGDTCASGYLCQEVGATGAHTCSLLSVQNTVGDACTSDGLPLCNPLLNLVCQSGACASLGDGSDGTSCIADFNRGVCDEGLSCMADSDTCEALRATGGSCEAHDDCASGSCDFDAGTCRDAYCGAGH